MKIRLSIIIPFYNVEKYITECLDSVYNQDIPEEEYEVICVNDASPDGSRDIVLKYQEKHPNLILVEHEVNKKLGAARNTGRRIARGKYLWNVDSDDMITPNCLREILDRCETNNLDVLLFGFCELTDSLKKVHSPWDNCADVVTGISFWKEHGIPHQNILSQVWSQVFRKDFLDDQKIFSPEINMGEDVPYSYSSILLADRLIAVPDAYYIYRINPVSLTGTLLLSPSAQTVYEHCFICSRHLNNLRKRVSTNEKEVINSIRMAVRFVVLGYEKSVSSMEEKQVLMLRSRCRCDFLKNLFVFNALNWRQGLSYLRFLI